MPITVAKINGTTQLIVAAGLDFIESKTSPGETRILLSLLATDEDGELSGSPEADGNGG